MVDVIRRPLGQRGPIQIAERAARIYAEALDVTTADARAALLELLPGAAPKGPGREGQDVYRYRSRETGLDVSAFVRRDGPAYVVEAITVRGIPHRNGTGRGKIGPSDAIAALLLCEWAGHHTDADGIAYGDECPVCHGQRFPSDEASRGHRPTCILDRALTDAGLATYEDRLAASAPSRVRR